MAVDTIGRTTIKLKSGDKVKLQEIARHLGYTQDRGKEKGQGSISALMQALASGKIVLQKEKKAGVFVLEKKEKGSL